MVWLTEQGAVSFQLIALQCLEQVQTHAPGVVRSNDPECVHQMRVNLRRLRSALRLFAQWIRLPEDLRSELHWLDDCLGAARDSEVLAESTLPALAAASPAKASWQSLQQAVSATAHENRHLAATAVSSMRYAKLMLGLVAWLQSATDKSMNDSMERQAPKLLARLHRKLGKTGGHLLKGTAKECHRARKWAKQLRYAAEFTAPLFRPGHMQRYIKRLATLQDVLGRLNDLVVAEKILNQVGRSGDVRVAATMLRQGHRKIRRDLKKQWKQFRATRRPKRDKHPHDRQALKCFAST